jgi:hypothetical protein
MNADKLITWNFYVAVWLSIIGGIAAFNFPEYVFPDEDGMYGPLRNNVLIAVGYLVLGQVGLWFFRYFKGSRFEALFMGYTFLATAAGAKFFAEVNGLPVTGLFIGSLVYFAVSHGLYYFSGKAQEEKRASSGGT